MCSETNACWFSGVWIPRRPAHCDYGTKLFPSLNGCFKKEVTLPFIQSSECLETENHCSAARHRAMGLLDPDLAYLLRRGATNHSLSWLLLGRAHMRCTPLPSSNSPESGKEWKQWGQAFLTLFGYQWENCPWRQGAPPRFPQTHTPVILHQLMTRGRNTLENYSEGCSPGPSLLHQQSSTHISAHMGRVSSTEKIIVLQHIRTINNS